MLAIGAILLPIFGLIGLGYVAGLRQWLGAGATDRLNAFVVRLALPAQLFLATARTPGSVLLQPGLLAIFSIGCFLTAGIGWALDWRRPVERHHRLSGAAIEGLCAGYGNTAFIGIPLCLAAFGPRSMAVVTVATLLTVCVLFAVAITLVEIEQAGRGSGRQVALRVARGLSRNPIVALPLLGACINASGIALPGPFIFAASMLGAASSPCALITIGLFLADTRRVGGGAVSRRAVARLVGLKLAVQPALTLGAWALMRLTPLALPDALTMKEALVLASLPTGTGPFMLAKLYEREAAVASRAILISTLLSALSLAILLRLLG